MANEQIHEGLAALLTHIEQNEGIDFGHEDTRLYVQSRSSYRFEEEVGQLGFQGDASTGKYNVRLRADLEDSTRATLQQVDTAYLLTMYIQIGERQGVGVAITNSPEAQRHFYQMNVDTANRRFGERYRNTLNQVEAQQKADEPILTVEGTQCPWVEV
jgi:hypothetical protein